MMKSENYVGYTEFDGFRVDVFRDDTHVVPFYITPLLQAIIGSHKTPWRLQVWPSSGNPNDTMAMWSWLREEDDWHWAGVSGRYLSECDLSQLQGTYDGDAALYAGKAKKLVHYNSISLAAYDVQPPQLPGSDADGTVTEKK